MQDIEVGSEGSSSSVGESFRGYRVRTNGAPPAPAPPEAFSMPACTLLTTLDAYEGSTVEEQIDACIEKHNVVMVTRSWCPFSKDAKEFLEENLQVQFYVVHVDEIKQGSLIFKYLTTKTGHKTVPMIFCQGRLLGGCDTLKALHEKGTLEKDYLAGLVRRPRTTGTETLETSKLLPPHRGTAIKPLFWFPNIVNNNVIRVVGLQVFCLSVLSTAFFQELWGRYLAVGLLIDFGLRFVAGAFVSPLGMIATVLTSPWKPDFRPGPPKQFASFCGVFFSLMGTIFFFVEFDYHEIVGAAFMGGLAGASGLEGFCDFCFGCLFYGYGIQFGLIPDGVYRIYSSSKQETKDSWDYRFLPSNAPKPERIDTDPSNPIALKYKKKIDEWTKDDFDIVRNMQVSYFGIPLSLVGLAVALKIATGWSGFVQLFDKREFGIYNEFYYVVGALSAFVFACFFSLYAVKIIMYPKKVWKEFYHPLNGSGFGAITIAFLLFSYIVYDRWDFDVQDEGSAQTFARIWFWIGAVGHSILTVAKMGEWIGRSLEMEHLYVHWMMMPVGLAVAALVAPIVGPFAVDNSNAKGNLLIARFFFSFAQLMWIVLFAVTFLKAVTTPNSDPRVRHGYWIWLAAPCVIGMASFVICTSEGFLPAQQCAADFSNYFFIGIFVFLSLLYATFPVYNFFGSEQYNAGYWIECFALDTLAACAALFYAITGYEIAETLQMIFIAIASIANLTAFLHLCYGIIRRRGVFTPEQKWGPLSFMKLTHEAIRGHLPKLERALDAVDLSDKSMVGNNSLKLFAAHLNQLVLLHEEHSCHEDKVIFKLFNDLFPEHGLKYNKDHADDHKILAHFSKQANLLLDVNASINDRQDAFGFLKAKLPKWLAHLEEHLQGEEDNLQPVGKKYVPLALMKEVSRQVWEITPANRWEVIVPYIVNNLPRHEQRVRYVKVLTWAMPERAQQIGAIVYRNVDAVMWERLRIEMPEIIPRGAPNWQRYY